MSDSEERETKPFKFVTGKSITSRFDVIKHQGRQLTAMQQPVCFVTLAIFTVVLHGTLPMKVSYEVTACQ